MGGRLGGIRGIVELAVVRGRLCGLADLMLLVRDQGLRVHPVQCHPVVAMMAHEVREMHPFRMALEVTGLGDLWLGSGRAGRRLLAGRAVGCHGGERSGEQSEGCCRCE